MSEKSSFGRKTLHCMCSTSFVPCTKTYPKVLQIELSEAPHLHHTHIYQTTKLKCRFVLHFYLNIWQVKGIDKSQVIH